MISNAELDMIFELDLNPIKVKLMHKESGEGWTLEQANGVEFEYRRFLCLMKLFPLEQTAPLFDVDTFWHYHILDTMKYAADCEQVFGYFLHHFPYIGLRGEDDEAAHHQVGVRMKELYEATFGEAYLRQDEAQAATAWSSRVVTDQAYIRQDEAQAATAWSSRVVAGQAYIRPDEAQAATAWSSRVVAGQAYIRQDEAQAATAWSSRVVAQQATGFYSDRPKLANAA